MTILGSQLAFSSRFCSKSVSVTSTLYATTILVGIFLRDTPYHKVWSPFRLFLVGSTRGRS